MIDLKEAELLVEAGKLRNAELLAFTLKDKQSSGYIDLFTLTLFAKNIVDLDAIFHDEEVCSNEIGAVERGLNAWSGQGSDGGEEWWDVGLLRLVDPDDSTVHAYDADPHNADEKRKEKEFRAAYAAIREKLNEPPRK